MEGDTEQNVVNSCEERGDLGPESSEQNLIKFLDSMDSYLFLMNSLSSALRQGWLELASARHSMGGSRINSALFDLKDHSAATTLPVQLQLVGPDLEQPLFSLHKWVSSSTPRCTSADGNSEFDQVLADVSNGRPFCGTSPSDNYNMQEKIAGDNGSPHIANDQDKKERSKRLSVFGALVSPKLRSAQLSFETALETLAEIANVRASVLCAYDLVQREMESTLETYAV